MISDQLSFLTERQERKKAQRQGQGRSLLRHSGRKARFVMPTTPNGSVAMDLAVACMCAKHASARIRFTCMQGNRRRATHREAKVGLQAPRNHDKNRADWPSCICMQDLIARPVSRQASKNRAIKQSASYMLRNGTSYVLSPRTCRIRRSSKR